MLGKINPMDAPTIITSLICVPWVSQIYLTLAAFNLASRDLEDFKKVWKSKLSIFGLLFLFFVAENFMVAQTFGEAVSLYPIMTWMIILSLLTVVYRFVGVIGIVFLLALSLIQFLLPEGFNFEAYARSNIHPNITFDAAPNLFLASGSLGFLMGWGWYHSSLSKVKSLVSGIIMGVILFLIGFMNSQRFYLEPNDLFATEHLKAITFFGTTELLGIQLFVLSLFLLLHYKNIMAPKIIGIFNWIGIKSITIFAFHRIFFLFFFIPVMVFVSAKLDKTVGNNILVIYSAIGIYLLVVFGIIKSKIKDLVVKDGN